VTPVVAPAVAAANQAALHAEIAAIKATPKVSQWTTDAAHANNLEELEKEAKDRFRSRNNAAAQIVLGDSHGPILVQLQLEVQALKKLHREHAAQGAQSPYGDPFDSDNKERYRFCLSPRSPPLQLRRRRHFR
jgi:hypothetical protein